MEIKRCTKCSLDKELICFNKNKAKKSGYNSYCKECNQLYQKKHYNDNKLYYLTKKDKQKNKLKEFIKVIKAAAKCSRCLEDDIACLDFHHIDDKNKDFNIGFAMNKGVSFATLQKEIDKCEILCSNCHRKLHYYE